MRSIALPSLILSLSVQALAQGNNGTTDKVVILMPKAQFQTVSGQVNLGTGSTSVEEAAERVLPRFIKETRTKHKWKGLEFVEFNDAKAAQGAETAGMAESPAGKVRFLDAVAKRLGARYVVTSEVREMTSYRASSLLVDRKGGRVTMSMLIYDANVKKYVYEATKTATSVHASWTGGDSLRAVQDQALINAYFQSLEPFAKKGTRMEITTASIKLLGTIKGAPTGGKVLLDLGSASGLHIGDELISLDGSVRLKVVEVLENGSIAEILQGTPEKDMAVRTAE